MRCSAVLAVALGACASGPDEPRPAWGYDVRPANATCVAPDRPSQQATVVVERAFPLSWERATSLAQPPGDPDWWWVTTAKGDVRRFRSAPGTSEDERLLRLAVDAGPREAGLLGLAFHPDFATNGFVFLSFTEPGLTSVVARFHSPDGASVDAASRKDVLRLDQPFNNHNGGHLAFGPDGYLYVGFGDGGDGGDPQGHGQNPATLLGALLRIDVDTPEGTPYAIPADNPFVGGGGRPEIFAYGFRNPWRFSFDRETGALWLGDVGQNRYEEIHQVVRGANHGWNVVEGEACFEPREGCDDAGLEPPVVVLGHDAGDQSVVGGVVYRGEAIAGLQGTYLFGDFASGRLYGLTDGKRQTLYETGGSFAHFAEDARGEVFLLDHSRGVFRLVPGDGAPVDSDFPERLSQTGCVDPSNPRRVRDMLIPYTVAHGFWSDGAVKRRWLSIPDGTEVSVRPDGRLVLPVGSVTVKDFTVGGELVETRLLVRHDDGEWGGYSYVWDGDDAYFAPERLQVPGGGETTWQIPSPADCLACHTSPWGGLLGLSLQQLDVLQAYPNGATVNQVEQLVRIGMLDAPERPGRFPALGDPSASAEARARAYLHVNCAFCHFEGGTGGGSLDLRAELSLEETGLCDAPSEGDLGLTDARIVAPGAPERSVLLARMGLRGERQMPPLASEEVDAEGLTVLTQWVRELPSCP